MWWSIDPKWWSSRTACERKCMSVCMHACIVCQSICAICLGVMLWWRIINSNCMSVCMHACIVCQSLCAICLRVMLWWRIISSWPLYTLRSKHSAILSIVLCVLWVLLGEPLIWRCSTSSCISWSQLAILCLRTCHVNLEICIKW